MTNEELKNLNPSGVATSSTPNNNVFKFISLFKEYLGHVEDYGVVLDFSDSKRTNRDLSKDEQDELVAAGKSFITAFQDYLLSGVCSAKPIDTDIIKLKLSTEKVYTNADVSKELGISTAVVRVRYARLTKRVYRKLFNSETIPNELVYCADVKVVKRALAQIRKTGFDFVLQDTLPYEEYTKVMKIVSGVDARSSSSMNEEEYLRALRFYFIYSKEAFDSYLKSIDKRMLSLVKRQLEHGTVNDLISKYNTALEDIENYSKCSEADFISALSDGNVEAKNVYHLFADCAKVYSYEVDKDTLTLGVGAEVERTLLKAIKTYKGLDATRKERLESKSTPESRKEVELFLKSLTTEAILNKARKLNQYDLVEVLKSDYVKPIYKNCRIVDEREGD